MEKMKELFLNPGNEYRTAPLWVWNADMSGEEIEKTLTELKEHGFGGAFVHPRPGMKVTYLDEAYFKAWGKALEAAKRLGLKLNIYDENSYPSGFGGGHVSCELPDCLSESVRYQVFSEAQMDFTEKKSDWLGDNETIAVYACDKKNGKMVFCYDVTDLPVGEWKGKGSYYAVMTHLPSQTAGWLAGFADIDRLRPEVTDKFLEKVYDAYAAHFQEDFGDTIQAIFTDEPALPGSTVYGRGGEGTLPVNHWFSYEFQKKKGYDIMKVLPCLFEDWEGFENEKIRHDYYEVTQELWEENFLKPIQKWCREHHLPFTGHFMEDGWPKPYYCVVSPSVMASYEYQDWPGIDLLLTGRLKNEPSEVQEISMLEVMSAAHQFGKERVFCEAYGAGGYDSGLKDYKRMGDYLFVNGVNFINEHLTYTSYVGARKRDHPQSFDWRQSWWNDYTPLNDYLGRMCAVLCQGYSRERVLVLNPTMTGYICPKDEDSSQLVYNVLAKEPNMRPFLQMLQDLRRFQWDINLGDEVIMKRYGKIEGGKLQIVTQQYEVVILHECIKNMLPSTIALLKAYMEQGGRILSVGRPGDFVSGVKHPKMYEELCAHENYLIFSGEDEMLAYLNTHYSRYFLTDTELPEGVESIRRVLDDGRELYFITNHSKEDVDTKIHFYGTFLEDWDPWNGTCMILTAEEDGEKLTVPLDLKDGESRLFCVNHTPSEKSEVQDLGTKTESDLSSNGKETDLVLQRILPLDENVWPLEYCDLSIDGETFRDYSTIAAGSHIFKKRGFLANPWDNEVQYKDRTYKRNRFYTENSGFSATYHFQIAQGFRPESLKLAVEYGDRYTITVNRQPVPSKTGEYFLDHLISLYDIHELVKAGENEVCITASKFDVELELEAVILKGSFGVYHRGNAWVMDAQADLKAGSIIGQGYPFYAGAVVYEGGFQKEEETRVMIQVPDSEATAVSITVNGVYAGPVNINGVKALDITRYTVSGKNKIEAKVCASMKNLLGPHFDPEKPRNTAWPDMWKKAPKVGNPSPKEYDLISYGLLEAIKIIRY